MSAIIPKYVRHMVLFFSLTWFTNITVMYIYLYLYRIFHPYFSHGFTTGLAGHFYKPHSCLNPNNNYFVACTIWSDHHLSLEKLIGYLQVAIYWLRICYSVWDILYMCVYKIFTSIPKYHCTRSQQPNIL